MNGSDEQGESLEKQVQYYENPIKANPEYEYVDVFADRGITGTMGNRPKFQRMLTLCREGKIDLIITKSISRFSRNTVIMLKVVSELKSLNIEVHFQKENIKTLSGTRVDDEAQVRYYTNYIENHPEVKSCISSSTIQMGKLPI